ncbi:MAG: NAD(P)-binding domain-containing protein [Ardenticatenaceae bacterium]|nr:NAD(P)-binding domain-containing protein [Ardenticatenaceae bacterium]
MSEQNYTHVAIIGAGPLGIETAIALERQGVDYTLFEATQVGSEFLKWAPETRFFSTPEHVALAGIPFQALDQQGVTGEAYLAYLRMLVEMYDLNVHVYEPVTQIVREHDGFTVHTKLRTGPTSYRADHVILSTGGMAGPRLLHIPGEDLPHVTHYFKGPHPYFRTRLLIVGGKNSAMEAALRCWRAGVDVTLSYRRPELNFERIKPHLSMDIGDRLRKGEIKFLNSTLPVEITPTHTILASTQDGVNPNGQIIRHETDFVYLATGFTADMSLFEKAGVNLLGEEQAPQFNPDTMETNVPNLYVVGTAAGGTQLHRFKLFISTTHDHVIKAVKAITGKAPKRVGTVPKRNNAVTYEEVKAN